MSDFEDKMHKIRFPPQTRLGELIECSPGEDAADRGRCLKTSHPGIGNSTRSYRCEWVTSVLGAPVVTSEPVSTTV